MTNATNDPPLIRTKALVLRTNSRHPQWSVDPLTQRLMEFPVTLRAPCRHTMDKTSFVAWTNQGNTVCPVCFTPMTQVAAFPNRELADRIQMYSSKGKELLQDELHASSTRMADHKTDLVSETSIRHAQKHVRFRSILEEAESIPSSPPSSEPKSVDGLLKRLSLSRIHRAPAKNRRGGKPGVLEAIQRNLAGPPTQKVPVLRVTVG